MEETPLLVQDVGSVVVVNDVVEGTCSTGSCDEYDDDDKTGIDVAISSRVVPDELESEDEDTIYFSGVELQFVVDVSTGVKSLPSWCI